MKNDKLPPSGIVSSISNLAGSLLGAAAVTGRRIGLFIRNAVAGGGALSNRLGKPLGQIHAKDEERGPAKGKMEGKETKAAKKTGPAKKKTVGRKAKAAKKKTGPAKKETVGEGTKAKIDTAEASSSSRPEVSSL